MKLHYQSIDDATVTYSGTAVSGYPVANLKDRSLHTQLRSVNINTTASIVIDFGAARACNSVVIGGFSLSGAVGDNSIKVEYSSDGVTYSDAYTYETNPAAGTYHKSFTSRNVRYYKVTLLDDAIGSTMDFQASTLFLGTALELSRNPDLDPRVSNGYSSKGAQALGGARFSFGDHNTLRREWAFNYNYLNNTDKSALESMYDDIKPEADWSRRPFYFENPVDSAIYYARLAGVPEFTGLALGAWSTALALTEEI